MPNPLGSISVNQAPQYGDKTVLEQSAKATKPGAVSGAVMPAPKAGRPAGQPTAQGASGYTVPPEHEALAQRVAKAAWLRTQWQQIAQQYPSRWTIANFKAADRDAQRLAMEARETTPWFED